MVIDDFPEKNRRLANLSYYRQNLEKNPFSRERVLSWLPETIRFKKKNFVRFNLGGGLAKAIFVSRARVGPIITIEKERIAMSNSTRGGMMAVGLWQIQGD